MKDDTLSFKEKYLRLRERFDRVSTVNYYTFLPYPPYHRNHNNKELHFVIIFLLLSFLFLPCCFALYNAHTTFDLPFLSPPSSLPPFDSIFPYPPFTSAFQPPLPFPFLSTTIPFLFVFILPRRENDSPFFFFSNGPTISLYFSLIHPLTHSITIISPSYSYHAPTYYSTFVSRPSANTPMTSRQHDSRPGNSEKKTSKRRLCSLNILTSQTYF